MRTAGLYLRSIPSQVTTVAAVPPASVNGGRKAMNTQAANTHRTTETLRAAIAGQVSGPGEPGYDQARQAWNLAADQRPSVFVSAESPTDVAQAVRFARAHRIRIAP